MAGRKFSMKQYFDARAAEIEPLFAFHATDEAGARAWRGKALAKVRDLLGEMPESVWLGADTVERTDMGSYIREKVIFDADAHSSVPGYLLIPKSLSGPAPAVLCLHGHGPGKDPVAGVTDADECFTEDQKREIIRMRNYDYGRQFAEQGYITFTFDFRCFGERADAWWPLPGRDRCNVQFIRGAILGINLLALDIHDAIRAVDYLQEREEVDPTRIGCCGLSFGGAMTIWTAALDRRIKAAVISGCLCEFDTFAVSMANFCGSQFVPALRRYFDMCDIAALIVPRPLLVESGIADEGFPIESVRRAFEKLKRAYEVWDKPECVSQDLFEGGHQFHGGAAFEWFARWL